ncbi:MAG TPA: EamA family transporter RarD [Vicinamibacterales bacterium]|nr:EamA family transporter RarD [Vicinamibacterales bacterium]
MSRGFWYGLGAYAIWGLFPIYWTLIEFVPADQIIAHRIVWSFLLLVLVRRLPIARRERMELTRGVVGLYAAAAVLIAVNWFVYVWAVTHHFIVETSLGYFITPLVNVLLGVVFLRERLRTVQWVAIALAAAGVGYLAIAYGDVPWIAMGLAVSFGTYGLVKKKAPLGSVAGLTLETGLLFVPALVFLSVVEMRGTGAFLRLDPATMALVAAAGPITTLPLVLFAAAVQRIPLSAIGILQFIAPTIQFLLGTLVYHEPFNHQQLVGFAFVWSAVIVFAAEGILTRAQSRPAPVLDEGEF